MEVFRGITEALVRWTSGGYLVQSLAKSRATGKYIRLLT